MRARKRHPPLEVPAVPTVCYCTKNERTPVSEALSLRFQDITAEGLVIRETKFRKSRLVWLHETVVVALQNYLLRRAKFASIDDHLFVSRRGGKLCYAIVAEIF